MVNYSDSQDNMEKKIEKVELACRQPDSPENRAICHAMYHSCLKKSRVMAEKGEEQLAREWAEVAEIVADIAERMNPNFHAKR